jgi:hypothetical protein
MTPRARRPGGEGLILAADGLVADFSPDQAVGAMR